MILDVDVGNTRLKWLLHGDGEVASRGGAVHDQALATLASLTVPVDRLRVASVARTWDTALQQLASERWGVQPEFARVSASAAGLTCGYTDPARLGVDRWLAMLAAWGSYRQPLLVASAGTAMTLDWIDARGNHQGGYILPGYVTMGSCLDLTTWGVRVGQPRQPDLEPGRDTESAVANGCLAAMLGALRVAHERLPEARLVLTGGDAFLLAEGLPASWSICVEPDLVLQGLAVALP